MRERYEVFTSFYSSSHRLYRTKAFLCIYYTFGSACQSGCTSHPHLSWSCIFPDPSLINSYLSQVEIRGALGERKMRGEEMRER